MESSQLSRPRLARDDGAGCDPDASAPIEIRDARPGDRRAVVDIFAAAFSDFPPLATIVGDDVGADDRRRRLMQATLLAPPEKLSVLVAEQSGRVVGALTYADSPACTAVTGLQARTYLRVYGRRLPAMARAVVAILRMHPRTRHRHLPMVAVDLALWRRGIGGLLLAEFSRRCDEAGLPGYLETVRYQEPGRPSHERLYGRHGFRVEHVATLDPEWSLLGMTRPVTHQGPGRRGRARDMTRPSESTAHVREVAPDVFCLGPWGRTQTTVTFVRSGPSWVLIDAGWAQDGPRIERAAASLFGPGARPAAILLTHCHPDHAGSARSLAHAWNCEVYMHPDELPISRGDFASMQASAGPLDRWMILPLMRAMGQRRREALLARSSLGEAAHSFDPGGDVPGLGGWRCLPTPGHTPGHVAYFRPRDGVLIAGDALLTLQVNSWSGLLLGRQGLSAPPWYTTWDRQAARASIAMLARLEPSVLVGGHGIPLAGPGTADRVREFVARFAMVEET